MNDKPSSIEHAVLTAHRSRVFLCKNFREFQEAQLDLLDYMIATIVEAYEAAVDFQAKFDGWWSK